MRLIITALPLIVKPPQAFFDFGFWVELQALK
jgi:hypothetical protein